MPDEDRKIYKNRRLAVLCMIWIGILLMAGTGGGIRCPYISAGLPLVFRVHGVHIPALAQPDEESAEVMIRGLLNEQQLKVLEEGRDLDFHCRHRTETVRGSTCFTAAGEGFRRDDPSAEQQHTDTGTAAFIKNYMISGFFFFPPPPPPPTGSGKSTTRPMIEHESGACGAYPDDRDRWNILRKDGSDPSEGDRKDVGVFTSPSANALRKDPDIIVVSEMRDYKGRSWPL